MERSNSQFFSRKIEDYEGFHPIGRVFFKLMLFFEREIIILNSVFIFREEAISEEKQDTEEGRIEKLRSSWGLTCEMDQRFISCPVLKSSFETGILMFIFLLFDLNLVYPFL